jgi:hypothetical protein
LLKATLSGTRARKSWFKIIAPLPASLRALIRERIIGYRVATNDEAVKFERQIIQSTAFA